MMAVFLGWGFAVFFSRVFFAVPPKAAENVGKCFFWQGGGDKKHGFGGVTKIKQFLGGGWFFLVMVYG